MDGFLVRSLASGEPDRARLAELAQDDGRIIGDLVGVTRTVDPFSRDDRGEALRAWLMGQGGHVEQTSPRGDG